MTTRLHRSWSRTGLALTGAIGILAASFLPWARSGDARRTSYELVDAAERLDVVSGRAAAAAHAWYLLPLVVAGACLAASLRLPRVALGLSSVAALGATVLAALVARSPLATEYGWAITLVMAGVASVGVSRSVVDHRNLPAGVTRNVPSRHLKSRE